MATRATRLRILHTALELFNEHGTAAIPATRTAERSGISKSKRFAPRSGEYGSL